MKNRKHTVFYFLMAFFVFFSFSLTGEILARIFFKGILQIPPSNQIQDILKENPYIIRFKPFVHSHIPFSQYTQKGKHFSVSYKINSFGLRDIEVSKEKKEGVKRLLVIGDSVTEGHGIEFQETYISILRKLLEKDNWEVVNAGIQGAGIAHQSTNLPRYFQLNPDAILFATYENDLADDRRVEAHYRGFPILENPGIFFPTSFYAKCFNSKLFQVIYVFYYKYIASRFGIEKIIMQNSKHIKSIMTPDQMSLKTESFLHPSVVPAGWELTSRYYDFFKSELGKRKIPMYVVNLTYQPYQPGFDPMLKESVELLDNSLKKYLSTNGIPYLNIKNDVIDFYKDNKKSLSIPEDGHPNAEGHKLYADKIYPWLKEILPK